MTKPPRKGRPRIEDRANTIEAKRPWEAKGMSRSTWYRRKREKAKRDNAATGITNGERE